MLTRLMAAVVALMLAVALVACSERSADMPDEQQESTSSGEPTLSTALAFGVHERTDGKIEVVGELEYVELEGGFWRVVDPGAGDGAEDRTLMVIANGPEFKAQMDALEGKPVHAVGERLDGVSIRQAGPEMQLESIREASDTGDPAR